MITEINTFKKKIGKVTYIVSLHPADTAKEQLETKLKKLITHQSKSLDFKPNFASPE